MRAQMAGRCLVASWACTLLVALHSASALVHSPQKAAKRTAANGTAASRKAAEPEQRGPACGVVMVAIGEGYGKVGMKVAAHTRSLPVSLGWCPLDPALGHIPVTLYTDVPSEDLQLSLQEEDPDAAVSLTRYAHGSTIADVTVLPETALAPWDGTDDDGQLLRHLGGWRVRWLHVRAMLQSPYMMTLYLDVDALPCSSNGISRLLWAVVNKGAAIGTPSVVAAQRCQSTSGDCSDPYPAYVDELGQDAAERELLEWEAFTERNAGVVVIDGRAAKPILEEFAAVVKDRAGTVKGDQYALREALFKYRKEIPQLLFHDTEVCRYSHEHTCDTGCQVEHECHMQSLVRAGIVPPGTFQRMGISDA